MQATPILLLAALVVCIHGFPAVLLSNAEDKIEEDGGLKSLIMSFCMILFSELGDKTFFMTALLVAKRPKLAVFLGAVSAFTVLTTVTVVLGTMLPGSPRVINLIASGMFLLFGLFLIKEAYFDDVDEEKEEEEQDSQEGEKRSDEEIALLTEAEKTDLGIGSNGGNKPRKWTRLCDFLKVVFEAAVLVSMAELGDRSQFATLTMAAATHGFYQQLELILGVMFGHAICTGLAVLGGTLMAKRVSPRIITILAAWLFIMFSLIYLYEAY